MVEDSDQTRDIYATFLEHHGWDVLTASDGRAGIRLARTERPDIVVMNLSMPVIDGVAATELLREHESTAGIPIIVCTAYVREDGAHRALQAGCDSYLEKPVPPSRLLEEIERFVMRPAARPPAKR